MGLFGRKKKPTSSDRREHITCPYCMEAIKPAEILFMIEKEDGTLDDVFVTFAQKYQGYEEGKSQSHIGQIIHQDDSDLNAKVEFANGYPVKLSWRRNGGEERVTASRICPHCHCYLPSDIETMRRRSIVLLGATSCGKTTLITAMLNMMIGNLEEERPKSILGHELGSIALAKDSLPFARKMMTNSLIRAQRDPTDKTKPVFPLVMIVQNAFGEARTLVTIHDFAGEGLDDPNYFLNHPIGKTAIDGVIYAIDTCQLSTLSGWRVDNACMEGATTAIRSFSSLQKQSLAAADAVAVALTKFDAYMHFKDISPTAAGNVYRPELGAHRSGVDVRVIKDVSNSVRGILDEDSPATCKTIESVFNRNWVNEPRLGSLEYFATACLKIKPSEDHETASTARFEPDHMHRVCEPLLYMLARWGIYSLK